MTKEDRMFPIKIETNQVNGNGGYQITVDLLQRQKIQLKMYLTI